MSKETYIHVKRDLQMKICIHVKFAETYKYLQQGLNIYIHKETYIHVKRDLHTCQKRPTYMSKETYL